MTYEEKSEILSEINEEAIVYHGIEDALIGYIERFGMSPIAVYDKEKVLECLMKDGTSIEDAEEWYGYNIIGTWAGEGTPAFLYKFYEKEEPCRFSRLLNDWWTKTVTKITATLDKCGRLFRLDGK